AIAEWGNFVITLILAAYAFFSFQRVYHQGWFKTIVKLFLIGIVYFWILIIFGLSEAFISFLLF
ncbi:MAG: hypothetical protein AAF223_15270, partial [Bacteroidota bacterium]